MEQKEQSEWVKASLQYLAPERLLFFAEQSFRSLSKTRPEIAEDPLFDSGLFYLKMASVKLRAEAIG